MRNKKTIVILGGMGPQASAKLLQVLVAMATKDYGAKYDDDFPEIIVNSVSVPDFISSKEKTKIVLSMLRKRIRKLEIFNPCSFSIACNTAHILLDDLQEKTKIPFISIIDEVAKRAGNSNIAKIGLLGTPVTLKSNLYQKALRKQNILTLIPSEGDQILVEKIIRNVLFGKITNVDRRKLTAIAELLKKNGAQGIILGCTELPMIFPKDFKLKIFDSIEILAKALLKNYFEVK